MELLNFTTNNKRDGHNLISTQEIYEFDDVQVNINEMMQVTIDGIITITFDYEGSEDNRTGETSNFYIDSCDINILKLLDKDNIEINISKESIKSLKHEMQNDLEAQIIEN